MANHISIEYRIVGDKSQTETIRHQKAMDQSRKHDNCLASYGRKNRRKFSVRKLGQTIFLSSIRWQLIYHGNVHRAFEMIGRVRVLRFKGAIYLI